MVIGLPLATVMGYNREGSPEGPGPSLQQDAAFGEQLRTAILDSTNRAAGGNGQGGVRQDCGVGATGNRQAAAATAVDPAAGEGAGRRVRDTDWIPPIAATNTGSVTDFENPIPRMRDLLAQLGINPASIQFELLDDVNVNPMGGGHINHLMRVQTPNGRKEDYAVEYILRNPSITANEIVALNRLPTAPEHLRGI